MLASVDSGMAVEIMENSGLALLSKPSLNFLVGSLFAKKGGR